jgi:hypothetical protein
MTVQNPYAPPSVNVADLEEHYSGEETLIPNGRTCPAGNGWGWIKEGYRIFKIAPLMFWVALLICMMIYIVMSIIPVVNIAASITMPLLVAGFGSCARSAVRDGSFEVGQIFDGCRHRLGTQLLCGLIYFALIVAAVFVIALGFGASGLFTAMAGGKIDPAMFDGPMMAVAIGAIVIVCTLIFSAFIFAPYLIHEHENLSAPAAMMMSFKACFKNIASGLIFFLVMIPLSFGATILLGLGWLILIPVSYLAIYAAYRDIFIEQPAED